MFISSHLDFYFACTNSLQGYILQVNKLMLSFKQIVNLIVNILPQVISMAVSTVKSSASISLFKQPTWFQKRTREIDISRTHLYSSFNSIVSLSRASFPQDIPHPVYLDVALLNIYAKIHYLPIKYLSACEPKPEDMYFFLWGQTDN